MIGQSQVDAGTPVTLRSALHVAATAAQETPSAPDDGASEEVRRKYAPSDEERRACAETPTAEDVKMVGLLVTRGASLDAPDYEGATPIMRAAQQGQSQNNLNKERETRNDSKEESVSIAF